MTTLRDQLKKLLHKDQVTDRALYVTSPTGGILRIPRHLAHKYEPPTQFPRDLTGVAALERANAKRERRRQKGLALTAKLAAKADQ